MQLSLIPVVKGLQIGYYLLAVVLSVCWIGIIIFLLYQGAYQVGGLFVLMTIFLAIIAYANERPS